MHNNNTQVKDSLFKAGQTLGERAGAMITWLVISAAEHYMLGFTEMTAEGDVFRDAIPPFAKAKNLSDELVENRLAAFKEGCDAINSAADFGDGNDISVCGIPLLNDLSDRERVIIYITLSNALLDLDKHDDRATITKLMDYLVDFWGLEEYIK